MYEEFLNPKRDPTTIMHCICTVLIWSITHFFFLIRKMFVRKRDYYLFDESKKILEKSKEGMSFNVTNHNAKTLRFFSLDDNMIIM